MPEKETILPVLESTTVQDRIRMNVSTNSKGQAQLDITVETQSIENAKAMLGEAIAAVKETCKEQGLQVAGQLY